jgi:hypothetical protein
MAQFVLATSTHAELRALHGAACVCLSHAWQPLRSHLVRIASILSVRAMPKKKKTNPDWMRPTAERLDAVQQQFGASGEHLPPDAVVGMMYTAHPSEFNELASQPSLHPMSARPATADPVVRSHRQAGLQMHRAANLFATDFNPARHAVMVAGRPVQVPGE